jgi:1-acyl-sn-glycerol-3-phosphate acyltransferase
MSERFYKTVRCIGRRIFFHASAPRILHAERAARQGAYLLAANHTSPFDAALIVAVTPRVIYWLSIVEIFRSPFAAWFLRNFGAEPLDRGKVDTRTVRAIVRRLRAGFVVGLFPEGRVRRLEDSVLEGGTIDDGVCKLAQLAGVPVLPCVVLGSEKFARWTAWLPGAGTRWAVAFGEPVFPDLTADREKSCVAMREEIGGALRALQMEIADAV